MSAYPSFQGTVTELITPFTADGAVDYDLLRGEAACQVRAGVAGLFTNGLASEALSMNAEEQIEATRVAAEAAAGKIPVMGNIVSNSLYGARKMLAAYEKTGAAAVCFQPPSVYACSQKALFAFLDTLCKATSLPVGLYNAPQTGNTLSPDAVASLFRENPNLRYYKESTIDFVHIQNTMRLIGKDRDMQFLNGSDATTFSVMQLGGKGVVSLISAVFPKAILALTDAMLAGEIDKARDAQNRILQIRDALKSGPFVAGYKYASQLAGVPLGVMRKPLADLADAEKETIKTNLAKLGLI